MRIFIHIGYPKTGSSAIQSHVFTNQRWFESQGIYIPRSGYASGMGHARLINADLPQLVLPSQKDIPAEVELEALAKELASAELQGFKHALISWEGLPNLRIETIGKLNTALANHEVNVLAYLRDQVSLIQAAALKTLEIQGYVTAQTFFEPDGISENERELYDFAETLNRWHLGFEGRAQIRTRWFKRSLLKEKNVVIDFLDWIGVQPDSSFALQTRSVNTTIDSRAAALLLLVRTLNIPPKQLSRLTGALLQVTQVSEDQSKYFMTPAAQKQVHAIFSDSNARLFRDFRPENAPPTSHDLFEADDVDTELSPVFEYLRNVRAELAIPRRKVWDGGVLHSNILQELTRPPGNGWRGGEPNGVWSSGLESELFFDLPDLGQELSPTQICLCFNGHYREGHAETLLTINGTVKGRLDLSEAEVQLPLTQAMRDNGLELRLTHQFPQDYPVSGKDIAYKLIQIWYYFVW